MKNKREDGEYLIKNGGTHVKEMNMLLLLSLLLSSSTLAKARKGLFSLLNSNKQLFLLRVIH